MIKNKINKTIIFAAAVAVFTIAGSAYYISSASNNLAEKANSQVSYDEAKDIAIAKSGSGYTVTEIELDRDDARPNYEIELKNGTNEIDAKIDANTGEILKWEVEKDDDRVETKPAQIKPTQQDLIGEAKAKDIALSKAGSGYTVTGIELDRDDAMLNYDLELKNGTYEIDVEIDAYTGEILKWEVEKDDDRVETRPAQTKPTQQNVIGEAKAREIALVKAGKGFTIKEMEMDKEHGRLVYELELVMGNKEIDAEIDANTGQVLKWEVEIDD